MIELRESVFKADRENGNVEFALRELRAYVYAHMNTDLSSGGNAIKPPIQLKNQYEKLVSEEKQRVEQKNAQVYTAAQDYCEAQNPNSFYGASRIACVEDYISKNSVKAQTVPEALYKFDFTSPKWSPDLAGWSLFIGMLILLCSCAIWLFHRFRSRVLN